MGSIGLQVTSKTTTPMDLRPGMTRRSSMTIQVQALHLGSVISQRWSGKTLRLWAVARLVATWFAATLMDHQTSGAQVHTQRTSLALLREQDAAVLHYDLGQLNQLLEK